ncbi:MAG: hypothetical protein Q9168_003373 [Polycauliona sp. 1 TL-2023]
MENTFKPAIVLVHGAWHVPAHYSRFIERLRHIGFEVICPLLPTCDENKRATAGLYDDAKVVHDLTKDLVERSREVILLLHSYGGAVGTEAAQGLSKAERTEANLSGGVIHLVYMCGFMLQVGECVGGASLPRPTPDPVAGDKDGVSTFICESPVQLFYADIEQGEVNEMAALLVNHSGRAVTDTITYPAWRYIPTTYVRTLRDEVLFPSWQDRQIKAVEDEAIKITIETFDTSHSPFLSVPDTMIGVIERTVANRAGL